MKFVLGKKVGMSQVFTDKEGEKKVVPVTLVSVDSCRVTQVKTVERDGYDSIQVGFGDTKKVNKPMAGHLKSVDKFFRFLREFRVKNEELKVGDEINVSVFEAGDKVKVSGVSKGKGFQGVMKKYNFKGGPASHGQKHSNRKPGSIGSAYPEKVMKGKKMAGREGGFGCTQTGLEIVGVDVEKSLIMIKGSVPGNNGGFLRIVSQNR